MTNEVLANIEKLKRIVLDLQHECHIENPISQEWPPEVGKGSSGGGLVVIVDRRTENFLNSVDYWVNEIIDECVKYRMHKYGQFQKRY